MSTDTPSPGDAAFRLRLPGRPDGPAMHQLVAQCPPLDLNSVYLYLLLAEHFSHTCIVAQDELGLLGMVSGYIPPERSDVLFVWQVAVHPRARGQGLGSKMLLGLLGRPGLGTVRWMETTVSPGNRASRRLFSRLASQLQAPITEHELFGVDLFGADAHEAEPLLRIGPFSLSAVR
ncbi:MAG: diaminobutyrate acetyltransferase [Castellaniella sp.]